MPVSVSRRGYARALALAPAYFGSQRHPGPHQITRQALCGRSASGHGCACLMDGGIAGALAALPTVRFGIGDDRAASVCPAAFGGDRQRAATCPRATEAVAADSAVKQRSTAAI